MGLGSASQKAKQMNRSETEPSRRPLSQLPVLGVRLLGSLVLLIATFAGALTFLSALQLVDPQIALQNSELRQLYLRWVVVPTSDQPLLTAACAAGVSVIATGWLVASLRRETHDESGGHVLESDELGLVVVDRQGVRSVAEGAAIRCSGVIEARARVRGPSLGPIRLAVAAWVLPGTQLRTTGQQIKASAQAAVEETIGLDVRSVAVKLHVWADELLPSRVI